MAGDPTNASLWTDADVYVGPLSATNPATVDDPFSVDWGLVGLLDGDEGYTESRDEDKDDKYAWGGILVRTSRAHFKLTKSFTALEDNETTRSLIWPGSTETEIIVPRPAQIKMAFETREGDKVKRLITAQYAEVDLDGDVQENETDLTAYSLVATIFPTSGKVLFLRQFTAGA
ncbi:hypothetical protein GCM10011583_17930 [Streptomyces camponoticapitis]|uniref:Major tail protein n=1 Tax=Streptomyces camponoticapitis TaxID=1616125 RepID=A0ABQ2E1X9_9ACTN|nr:hypothetical protein [Streptomyces camponoticapitis]GGJ86783.1 hypothetical protein GCM10011583_17930 [Streptomyces camponoticapitis]